MSIANTHVPWWLPPHKLKWYRGDMQDWKMLGLTTVPPAPTMK